MYEDSCYTLPQQYPTLCEVSYEQLEVGLHWGNEVPLVPYRYRSCSSRVGLTTGTKLLGTQPTCPTAASFYQLYDPVTVGCRTPVSYAPPTRPCTTVSFYQSLPQGAPSRAHTLPPHYLHDVYSQHDTGAGGEGPGAAPGGAGGGGGGGGGGGTGVSNKKSRAKTAPCNSLPVLPWQRGISQLSMLSRHELQQQGEDGEKKVKWVPALNSWVTDKQGQSPVPYLSFVNSLTVGDQGSGHELAEDDEFPTLPCSRFLSHMHMHDEAAHAQHSRDQARLQQQRARRERFEANQHKLKPKISVEPQPSRVKFKVPKKIPAWRRPQPREKPERSLNGDGDAKAAWEQKSDGSAEKEEDRASQDGADQEEADGSSVSGAGRGTGTESGQASEADDVGSDLDRDESPSGGDQSDATPPKSPTPPPPKSPSPPPPPSSPPPITVPDAGSVQSDKTSDASGSESEDSASDKEAGESERNASKMSAVGKADRSSSLHKKLKSSPFPAKSSSNVRGSAQSKTTKVSDTERRRKKKPSKSGSNRKTVERQHTTDLEFSIRSEPDKESQKSSTPPPSKPLKTEVEKRVRWRAQPRVKEKPPSPEPQRPNFKKRTTGNWIFDGDDFSTQMALQEKAKGDGQNDQPKPPSPPAAKTPTPPASAQRRTKAADLPKVLPDWAKRRLGLKKLDKSWEEEMRRQQLAEERRKKAMQLFEKLKTKGYAGEDYHDPKMPRFEDHGWLAQYCILNKGSFDMYKHAFMAFDEEERGWLSPEDTILALRAMNRSLLSESEEIYMYRILEVTGYSVTEGSDLKLFAVLAALSQKIASLDGWMKNQIGKMDFEMLDLKTFMCKTLWECNVDEDSKKISIDQLCVELRAGGVSYEHETEVREKLGHLVALDLLDFLTYIPLFIMIHQSVVLNPLDDSREK